MKIYNALIYNTQLRRFLPGSLSFKGESIERVEYGFDENGDTDARKCYAVPGFVDVHTHGRGGYDVMESSCAELCSLAHLYAQTGVTSVFPTVMTAARESILSSVCAVRAASRDVCISFDGIHIEGPYISKKRLGCHPARFVSPLDSAQIAELILRISPLHAHITVAVEEEGADDFIKACVRAGATVGIGHSDATYDECLHALSLGAVSFTHTYNAMRPLHHREPGCVTAALTGDCYAEFICDGFHINPAVIRMSYAARGGDRFVLVTDSMSGAGMADGEYSFAGTTVFVKGGKILTGDGVIAASSLDMHTALKNLMSFASLTLEQALPAATENPARQVGIFNRCGSIEAGKRADVLLLSPDTLDIKAVFAKGVRIV